MRAMGVESDEEVLQLVGSEGPFASLLTPTLQHCKEEGVYTRQQVGRREWGAGVGWREMRQQRGLAGGWRLPLDGAGRRASTLQLCARWRVVTSRAISPTPQEKALDCGGTG